MMRHRLLPHKDYDFAVICWRIGTHSIARLDVSAPASVSLLNFRPEISFYPLKFVQFNFNAV